MTDKSHLIMPALAVLINALMRQLKGKNVLDTEDLLRELRMAHEITSPDMRPVYEHALDFMRNIDSPKKFLLM